MENHDWAFIKDSPECPYINKTLLPMASSAPMYFSPTGVHPSLPNYIWMEAGQGFGIFDDAPHQVDSTNHLSTQLDAAGIPWRSYQESLPPDTYPIVDHYPFAIRHCPQIQFKDVVQDRTYCLQHIRPYDEFASDIQSNRVARYNFITPNATNDMHDASPGFSSPRAAGDYWLSQEVPKILESEAFKDNGALFITWDEGTNFTDGPLGMIVVSPLAKGHGYSSTNRYTHSSTLRTMQMIFGVRPFLADAANALSLADLFAVFTLSGALSPDLTKIVLTMDGLKAGQTVRIDRSADLTNWSAWTTNTADSNTLVLSRELSNATQEFFRASVELD